MKKATPKRGFFCKRLSGGLPFFDFDAVAHLAHLDSKNFQSLNRNTIDPNMIILAFAMLAVLIHLNGVEPSGIIVKSTMLEIAISRKAIRNRTKSPSAFKTCKCFFFSANSRKIGVWLDVEIDSHSFMFLLLFSIPQGCPLYCDQGTHGGLAQA